jgi:iron complex transport system ATP-binding protein
MAAGEMIIDMQQADVFCDAYPVLRNITLQLRRGQHSAILGPNGSGKSSLLRVISGDLYAYRTHLQYGHSGRE